MINAGNCGYFTRSYIFGIRLIIFTNLTYPFFLLSFKIFPKASGQSRRGSDEERHFVEYWDIGGSASHENTRQVFYDNIHGIILVHDLTNKKSEANLSKWLTEITSKGRM